MNPTIFHYLNVETGSLIFNLQFLTFCLLYSDAFPVFFNHCIFCSDHSHWKYSQEAIREFFLIWSMKDKEMMLNCTSEIKVYQKEWLLCI